MKEAVRAEVSAAVENRILDILAGDAAQVIWTFMSESVLCLWFLRQYVLVDAVVAEIHMCQFCVFVHVQVHT